MSFTRKEYPEEAPRKILTPSEAKVKIASYCAYQERCQKEVRDKLYEYGLHPNEVENLVTAMILEGFLNEERFAKAFARGKFRIKKWGKLRIVRELKFRVSSDNLVRTALKEIDDQEYWETLMYLAEKKLMESKEKDEFKKKAKLYRFLTYKGYETDLVQSAIESLGE
ncbi:MAG TPA: regulatory protein RecX [Cyclobacteriaceae bacterium]|nr:regulatory protein RecX [Cyclobacteriaceae bacterium]